MTEIDNIIEFLGSEKIHGYGPTPIPSKIDEDICMLLEAMFRAEVPIRTAITARMKELHGFAMKAFAIRMAAYALRTNQSSFLRQGLLALAIAFHLIDPRDVIPIFTLIYRSAQKMGLDPNDLFMTTEASDPEFQLQLDAFLAREDTDKSIECMGYVESKDKDGFRYRRTW